MATNPLIAQGTLNRLRGSVVVTDVPELNVTASYLGKAGISLSLDGDATTFIPTMTGAVTSGEPYQMVTMTINLLKTQGLANLYKQRAENLSTLGDLVITPDASTLGTYPLTNCAIGSVRELSFAGEDAGYVVTIRGYYLINNSLWDLT
ncbi:MULTISPECIES: hypothetical protein [unclassified Herbaspirillum]|uniref:hypothetical protein n=1 Tax=unclassified Herbaspirillum TaxID=2624150 RepID=UPI000C0AF63A|nr:MULTISPECIES: hypothetical protein [unclassified Herbaspirillum]MAF04429.1 hypothetical protein [Herbaspirillum sp.]MBO18284.1 hypothetical protein [Herbaspirillum sp.]|tara:strand:- start:16373 stop:16819 length:447 start_codon:yes stop_codon:yes gene_type:complete